MDKKGPLRVRRGRYLALVGLVMGGLVLGLVNLRLADRFLPRQEASNNVEKDHEGPCSAGPGLSFVATNTGREQIYLLGTPRSSSAERVVRLPDYVSDPAWSPDGRGVAFRRFKQGQSAPDVYLANADGSHLQLLVKNAAMPDWSPDGRLIAFANLRSGLRGISVINVAKALRGVAATRIVTRTSDSVPEEQPTWAPDGKRIAFTSQRNGGSDVWIVRRDGSKLRNLTSESFPLDESPSWSPDGTLIAFGSNRESSAETGGDIYVMKADGTDVRRITFSDSAYAPAWSPDGCGIAFNSAVSGASQIYVMRNDGSGIYRVTTLQSDVNGDETFACCAAWRLGN